MAIKLATSEKDKPRIGILTAGGDCPGLNAVIRGVVKSGYRMGYEVLGFVGGFEGLADPVRYRELTPQNTSGILVQGGTILGSTNRGRFGVTVGEDKKISLPPDLLRSVRQTFDDLRLEVRAISDDALPVIDAVQIRKRR